MFALRAICDHFFVVAHSLRRRFPKESGKATLTTLRCLRTTYSARHGFFLRGFRGRSCLYCWPARFSRGYAARAAEAKRSTSFRRAREKPVKPGVRTTETRNQTKNKTSCAPSSGKSYFLKKKWTRMEFHNIHRKQGRFCRLWKTCEGATSRLSILKSSA